MKKAIISGSGLYDPNMLENVREENVETKFGAANVMIGDLQGEEVAFLPRHGRNHSVPPHKINYRANFLALKKLGVEEIIATAAVGSLNLQMVPGDCVAVDQFLDFTKSRPVTYFEGGELGVYHVDYTEPYCRFVREAIVKAGNACGIKTHNGGTYVCTEGPRFETPAEIKMFGILGGDLVGMTTVPEVVLARELGMCYGTVAMVTNFAAGISKTPLTHQEVLDIMAQNTEKLRRLLFQALLELPKERACQCGPGVGDIRKLI
ncbi:MAG TPA: S-methyl-5'-thioadenosine phosphorylase [Bacillota bacterium]|nr:S-methyl-5'-thioadenosine phosphorylase [Bacillota bacterium]